MSPLVHHVLPRLGKTPVEDLDQNDIKNALAAAWAAKPETARKALARLGVVFRHATAMGLNVDLAATTKAAVLLGASRHQKAHIPAMPWQDVPRFFASLTDGGIGSLVVKLLILTATRSAEVRGLRPEEVAGDVWTVPAGRTKSGREHRVALSREALAVIEAARPYARDGTLFASQRGGRGVLSDQAVLAFMRRQGVAGKPHGFRTSFRTWCAETGVPREVAEAALAHAVDGSTVVERVYRQTDFLEQRRALMSRWAGYVTGRGSGEIVRRADGTWSRFACSDAGTVRP